MKQSQAEPVRLSRAEAQAPQGLELRHLRYLVAVAEAGTFTRAAERLFIAQPTLSQQIGRLEQLVGTPLLARRRDGVRLTTAGEVLLDVSRDVLSLVDHGVSRTRQAAGLGRPRLRVVMPPNLPAALIVRTAPLLRSAADATDVDLVWMETPLDAEFSPIRQHQADAGLGWLTADRHGGPGLERRPAPPAPADPVRHRRRRDPASTGISVPRWLITSPQRDRRDPPRSHGTYFSRRPTMPSAPYELSISAARAGALFVSPVQRSDEPSARQVQQAIATAIGVHGVRGCAARVAQAYGKHPETAHTRMRWALTAVASAFGGSPAEPAHAPAPGHSTMPCTSRAA